jgi:hypothetical protein
MHGIAVETWGRLAPILSGPATDVLVKSARKMGSVAETDGFRDVIQLVIGLDQEELAYLDSNLGDVVPQRKT